MTQTRIIDTNKLINYINNKASNKHECIIKVNSNDHWIRLIFSIFDNGSDIGLSHRNSSRNLWATYFSKESHTNNCIYLFIDKSKWLSYSEEGFINEHNLNDHVVDFKYFLVEDKPNFKLHDTN
jgi:hypothetical protein